MKNLKSQTVLLTTLYFFLGTSWLQSQDLFKYAYWNGENLEVVHAKIDMNNGELTDLYYQATVYHDKVKLKLEKKIAEPVYVLKYTATNPNTGEILEVSSGMTIIFTYPNGQEKEFNGVMEYINGEEKIIMGGMPILYTIIYQKGNNNPELWLESADLNCKDGQKEGKPAYLCNFTTLKGEELQLMIDQHGKNVTLWRNGETIIFREQE